MICSSGTTGSSGADLDAVCGAGGRLKGTTEHLAALALAVEADVAASRAATRSSTSPPTEPTTTPEPVATLAAAH